MSPAVVGVAGTAAMAAAGLGRAIAAFWASETNEAISSRPYQARKASSATAAMAHNHPRPPAGLLRDLPARPDEGRWSQKSTLRGWRVRRTGPRVRCCPAARSLSHLMHVQAGGWFTYQLVRSAMCVRSSILNGMKVRCAGQRRRPDFPTLCPSRPEPALSLSKGGEISLLTTRSPSRIIALMYEMYLPISETTEEVRANLPPVPVVL